MNDRDQLELAKQQAERLLKRVKNRNSLDKIREKNDKVEEVISVLEDIPYAEKPEDIPRQIGGVLFFKSVEVEKELDIEGFPEEFRKIHVLLGRDLEMERNHIQAEKSLGSDARRIDEQTYKYD